MISDARIEELADYLRSRKNQGQRVGILLGHRVGVLYHGKLQEALESQVTIAQDLMTMLKFDTAMAQESASAMAQELAGWKLFLPLLADLPKQERFRRYHDFLGKHFTEMGIHRILSNILATADLRKDDKSLAELINAEFFDTIFSTNIDPLLDGACDSLGMEKDVDYGLFLCGKDVRLTISPAPCRCGQIVKLFGDFDSRDYWTVGKVFDLEKDQQLKEFLAAVMKKDVVVLGYDPTWDQPVEQAFQDGGMLWYMNEDLPQQNTHLARILDQRYTKYLGVPEGNYLSFLQRLSDLVGRKAVWEASINLPLPPTPSSDPFRRKVFISYSHKNKDFLERLHSHLKGGLHLEKATLVLRDNIWDDTEIPLGAEWEKEIREALAQTNVAVLLVSADFFASDFIREKELPMLMQAAEEGKVQIWPVIISDSVFERTKLYAYEAINPVSKPLIGMPPVECEALWARLAEKIFIALEQQK